MPHILKVGLSLAATLIIVMFVLVLAGEWMSDKSFTQIEMEVARRAVEEYSRKHGHLPATLEEALEPTGKPRVVDIWGDSFRYVVADDDHALLLSLRTSTKGASDALVLECVRQDLRPPCPANTSEDTQ